MKTFRIILLSIFILSFKYTAYSQERLVFSENFESGLPSGWKNVKVIGSDGTPSGPEVQWKFQEGGYDQNPDYSYQGSKNAVFYYLSQNEVITKLVTGPIDLSDVVKPELRFGHVQETRTVFKKSSGGDPKVEYFTDNLFVYYKEAEDSAWVLLKKYETAVDFWTEQNIQLPDSGLSSTYYLAFEGHANSGYGTAVDSVRIYETGVEPKYLDNYYIRQASEDFVITESSRNLILRIDFDVKGNEGDVFLNAIDVTSLNTDDTDIASNGVRLWATSDTVFNEYTQIGTAQSLSGGVASFTGLNHSLPRGISSVWVSFDMAAAASHDVHNHTIDAMIETEAIDIEGYLYPFSDQSPNGHRVLKEALFFDDFEGTMDWTLNSFEWGAPQGLGQGEDIVANPDPESAYNGTKVLGTDLSSDGVYGNNLPENAFTAITPTMDASYFQDITLVYQRYLNTGFGDTTAIAISLDNESTWSNIWFNRFFLKASEWSQRTIDISSIADDQDNINLRWSLGPTNETEMASGWNIDDVAVIGDFISDDVGVSQIILPYSSCGHTSDSEVRVYVKNYGGEPSDPDVPIRFTVDGGASYTWDVLEASIPVGDSVEFTFSTGADLTVPGPYTIQVQTRLPGDEIPSNDAHSKEFFSFPTYSPPYAENFESSYGYWLGYGRNANWEYGEPTAPIISSAASGDYAWVTNLNGNYQQNDSSFLMGPCFDFTGLNKVIFEYQLFAEFEENTDGMALQYSIDGGLSWNVIEEQGNFNWDWYTSDLISSLNSPGWDTTMTEWNLQRVLLPNVLSGESSVKFRFAFTADDEFAYEGAGIDNIKIYEAPQDVGIESLLWPQTQCELSDTTTIKVKVKNYGVRNIQAGSKIPLNLKLNGENYKQDTLELASALAPGEAFDFLFDTIIDMSYVDTFILEAFTLYENNPFFYSEACNDTIIDTVAVIGMPNYDIGDIIGVDASSTIDTTLDAGPGYTSYLWNTGAITQTIVADAEGTYYVDIENEHGCTASDTLEVVGSLDNIEVSQLLEAIPDSCERILPVAFKVELLNKGLKDYVIGEEIPMAFQLNDQEPVLDTLVLTQNFNREGTDSTVQFTFNQTASFDDAGVYEISIFSNFDKDLNKRNDTLYTSTEIFGLPDVELAYDTIYSSSADTITLDAGPGFASYTWQGSSGSQTYNVPDNQSRQYKVVVTDIYGCGEDADSTQVITKDLAIASLANPTSDCEHTAAENIQVQITNNSGDILTAGSDIPVAFQLDEAAIVRENITLSTDLGAGSSKIYTLSNTIDLLDVGDYNFTIWLEMEVDANRNQDTLNQPLSTYGYPNVELAWDTIFTTQPDTIVLDAGPGFASYEWLGNPGGQTFSNIKDSTFTYDVRVTDFYGCGEDRDTTLVVTYNIGLQEILEPVNSCELSDRERIRIAIKNLSADTLRPGTEVELGYILDGNPAIIETKQLNEKMAPGDVKTYRFSTNEDFSSFATYDLQVWASLEMDAKRSNDTINQILKTFGYPDIELEYDQILTTQPDTVTLSVDPGYFSYNWNNGYKGNVLNVDYLASYNYILTVSDINGCKTIDSTIVATYDLGVTALNTPVDACELSASETVAVDYYNFGPDSLPPGHQFDIEYNLNGGAYHTETITLADSLYPAETHSYTFTGTADMSDNQLYAVNIRTAHPYEVTPGNDAFGTNVDFQAPDIDLGDDVITSQSTYTINAGSGYTSYLWFDGSENQTYVADVNNQTADGNYHVTVTNALGCEWSDTINVSFNFEADLGISDILQPTSGCLTGDPMYVEAVITNYGTSTILSGTQVTVGYTVNGTGEVTENYSFTANFGEGAAIPFQFSNPVSLENNTTHTIEVYTQFAADGNASNNSDSKLVTIEDVNVDLGPDTIYTDFPYVLDPGNYAAYLWQDGSENESYTVTAPGKYSVTVTDNHGCQGSDEIYVGSVDGTHEIITSAYAINFYPNPTKGMLNISIEAQEYFDWNIEILNASGQKMKVQQNKNVRSNIIPVDLTGLPAGTYILKISNKKEVHSRLLIKQ